MSEETISQIGTPTETPTEQPTETPQADAFVMPEKFVGKSAEEIAKSYVEYEKHVSSKTPSTQTEIPNSTSEETSPASEEPAQIKPTETPSLEDTIATYSDKFIENGNRLLPEDYEALAKQGLSKGIVDQFVKGQVLEGQQQQAVVDKVLGGKENQERIFEWAQNNMSPEEVKGINEQLKKDPEVASTMLKLRYEASVPQSGNLLKGKGAPASVTDVFHSQDEIVQAMRDPNYGNGGSVDLEIKAKIARSHKAGTIK